VLVTDSAPWASSGPVSDLVEAVHPIETVARAAAEGDLYLVARVREAARRHPGSVVLAVGGGSVLDAARIAALMDSDARVAAAVPAALGRDERVFMWPGARGAGNPVFCVPSTLGTAAEVSPVAIVRGGGRTLLCVSPALRSRVAALDPDVTATLDRATLLAGLVEPMSRAAVPAVAGAALAPADRLASALVETLVDLGTSAAAAPPGAVPDAEWRLAAALTSAATHTTFLAVGRAPFGHALWPVATEVMAATGLSKPAVLGLLLPVWLDGLASGALGPAFGTAARVRTILGADPAPAAARLRSWLAGLQLAKATTAFDIASVTARVERWQENGFLQDAAPAEIAWLVGTVAG
jgi:NADP-dependent alcohol dehydrogenase